MQIKNLIKSIIIDKKENKHFQMIADSDGLNFVMSLEDLKKCETGEENSWLLHQYICLKMSEEQGIAEKIANGYLIPSDYAVAIDEDTKLLLDFPPPYIGSFQIRVNGQTTQESFSIRIIPVLKNGKELYNYQLKGPCLQFSPHEIFLLNSAEWCAFKALQEHEQIPTEKKSELYNLKLIGSLQAAQKLGMAIDLSHFNKIEVKEPEKIGVAAILQEDKSLILTPTFGAGIDPEKIRKRLGQLDQNETAFNGIGVIRIQDKIVVLEEKRLQAANEIISNECIPSNQVKRFLESPTAFLDASLVDLDAGFSLRVRGATTFKHAYFGETDESGIGWFEQAALQADKTCQPSELYKLITTEEDLKIAKKCIDDAQTTGASVVEISEKTIDISDSNAVQKIIQTIEKKIAESIDEIHVVEEKEDSIPEIKSTIVVDIIENDEQQEYGTDYIPAKIREASYKLPIDYSPYKRKPFPHQKEGISWILGLAEPSISLPDDEESLHGALLADDMGLGKTYMTLVAIAEYYKQCREKGIIERPVLIVVPLTLLEVWRDEINETLPESSYFDIVILQSNADLSKFRIEGTGIEIRQQAAENILYNDHKETASENAIRYSLKVGKEYRPDNLDITRRIVLTTYQTLRDYQFSLCRVDWSFVVFDEAQHIKNPNTLATRAAKGLKAKFKLLSTGTPVENHLGDFWCLMDTARPGALGAYQEFRQKYMLPIRRASAENLSEVRQSLGKELRNYIGALMLRRLKEDNLKGLPKKNIFSGIEVKNDFDCCYDSLLEREMEGEQLQRYDTAIDTIIEMQHQGVAGNIVLKGLHQLREISLHPLLLNGGMLSVPKNGNEARELFHLSGKLTILLRILDRIKNNGEKAIVFAINKRLQSFLKIALGRIYNVPVEVINGDTKAISKSVRAKKNTRKGIIKDFESKEGFGLIIMSPIAAGTGLTVVAANNVIHIERHWNPAKENQATDRVFRIGQKKDVNIYLPILKHPSINSFDVNLHQLLSNKVTLKDAVVTPEEVTTEEMARANFRSAFDQEKRDGSLRGYDLSLLSWQEFEALCAEIFAKYFSGDAFLTSSNDFGADVVIFGEKNALIQCKYTSGLRYDSIEPLVQIHGAKPIYEEKTGKSFSQLIFAVNVNKISKKVRGAASTYRVDIVKRNDLDELLKKYPITRKQIQRRLLSTRLFER